jgi:hypothetical protein
MHRYQRWRRNPQVSGYLPQTGERIESEFLLCGDCKVAVDTIPCRAEPLDRGTSSEGQVTDIDLWRRTVIVIIEGTAVVIIKGTAVVIIEGTAVVIIEGTAVVVIEGAAVIVIDRAAVIVIDRAAVIVIDRAAVVIVITLPQAGHISETIGVVTVVVTIGVIIGAVSAEIARLDRAIITAASRTQRQDQKQ